MKFFFVFFIFLIISCNQHPHQNVIDNLKQIHLNHEENVPFSKNFKLIGFKDSLVYFLLLNCYGTEITGNIFLPQKNSYFELKGNIDVTGSFIAKVYNLDNQFIDTLKGYFIQEEIKCAFTKNYENVLIGSVLREKTIPVNLYSLKLSGKSENYSFVPQPQLLVHHTYLGLKDTHQKTFQSELSKQFFNKILFHSDSIYNQMSKDILQYKDTFEIQMKSAKKVNNLDSLHRTWIKKFEVVYNRDSILSFYFLDHKKEGFHERKNFQAYVWDFKKNRFLKVQDLPNSIQKIDIHHFLLYPNFIRIWKKNGTYENLPN